MSVKIYRNNEFLEHKYFLFPGGEIGIKINPNNFIYKPNQKVVLWARINCSNDFFELAMLKDAIERLGDKDIYLVLPYVPYARQDRVCDNGESLSLKVFADLINSLNFKRVTIVDPHSDVCGVVFNNVKIITQFDVINKYYEFVHRVRECVLVSADAGANKKVSIIAKFLNTEFVRADKIRELSTGEIKETVVYCDNFDQKDVLIADDICDGGRTFIELAKILKSKNCGKIHLYVTHGIFSKGTKVIYDSGIEQIWTTDSICRMTFDVYDIKILELEKVDYLFE